MAAARGSSARRPSRPQQRTHPWPPGSAAASRASADPIAATAPTAFAGPAPFRKWLPSTTPEAAWRRNRCGEAQPVVAGRPRGGGAQDRAKGNLVECRAKGLGEAQDLESDACGRRAERLDKHRVVLLAALGKAKKRLEAQPLRRPRRWGAPAGLEARKSASSSSGAQSLFRHKS